MSVGAVLLVGCVVGACVLGGCGSQSKVEATSLLGQALERPTFSPDEERELNANLAAAVRAARRDRTSEDAAIWHGRRLAYLGRYQEAIEVYTKALGKHPESYKLRRHRGHRYITTRQFDLAKADLREAARLAQGHEDEVEPDGAPNAMNIPRSTVKFNIYYHLGLAEQLSGDFLGAVNTLQECLKVSKVNDDLLCANLHWLYMSLRRLGRDAEAEALLADVNPYMEVFENGDYQLLLLMYKHEVPLAEVIERANEAGGVAASTLHYGVGNWHLCNGEPVRAQIMFHAAVSQESWAAFGYIAAEAEQARARR